MKGFSLVEVLIVGLISVLIGGILMSLFVQNNSYLQSETSITSQGLSLNDTLAEIRGSIKDASAVSASYTNGSKVYSSSLYTLVLSLPARDSAGNVIDNTFDYVVITTDESKQNVLRKMVYPDQLSSRKGENMVLNTNLKVIYFNYLDKSGNLVVPTLANSINITLNVKDPYNKKAQESSASTKINLKND